MPTLDPEIFWRFAVTLYGKPGVKSLCLSLQNDHTADINLVLLYLWLDQQHIAVTGSDRSALETLAEDWQASFLRPLRDQRKAHARTSPDYKTILREELELERREQHALISHINTCSLVAQQRTPEPYSNYNEYIGAIGARIPPCPDFFKLAETTFREIS